MKNAPLSSRREEILLISWQVNWISPFVASYSVAMFKTVSRLIFVYTAISISAIAMFGSCSLLDPNANGRGSAGGSAVVAMGFQIPEGYEAVPSAANSSFGAPGSRTVDPSTTDFTVVIDGASQVISASKDANGLFSVRITGVSVGSHSFEVTAGITPANGNTASNFVPISSATFSLNIHSGLNQPAEPVYLIPVAGVLTDYQFGVSQTLQIALPPSDRGSYFKVSASGAFPDIVRLNQNGTENGGTAGEAAGSFVVFDAKGRNVSGNAVSVEYKGTSSSPYSKQVYLPGYADNVFYVAIYGAGAAYNFNAVQGGKVYYHGNGGAGAAPVDNAVYKINDPVDIQDAGQMALTGYNFAGWVTDPTGPGTTYVSDATATKQAADLELWAVWVPDFFSFYSSGNEIRLEGTQTEASPVASVLDVPNGVTGANYFATYGGSIVTELKIPATLTNISNGAFGHLEESGMKNLQHITVSVDNPVYANGGPTGVEVDVLYNKTRTTLVRFPPAIKGVTSYAVPPTVVTIGPNAFTDNSKLSDVALPSSLRTIGSYAFSYMSPLTKVVFANGLETISDHAFYNTATLEKVVLSDSVKTVGGYAFAGDGEWIPNLSSIYLGNSLTTIGDYTFAGSSLNGISLPATLTSIGAGAFANSSYIGYFIIRSVPSIGADSLSGLGAATFYAPNFSVADALRGNNSWQTAKSNSGSEGDYQESIPSASITYDPNNATSGTAVTFGGYKLGDFVQLKAPGDFNPPFSSEYGSFVSWSTDPMSEGDDYRPGEFLPLRYDDVESPVYIYAIWPYGN